MNIEKIIDELKSRITELHPDLIGTDYISQKLV